MKISVFNSYDEISAYAAETVAILIEEKPDCILGLPTGSTPLGLYSRLIDMNRAGRISFARVTTYNLDEYYPIAPDHPQSYRYFMNTNLFDHIDIPKDHTFVPNGLAKDPETEGAAYDAAIRQSGGIDLQVLGIGQNGHIGFNEPHPDYLIAGTHTTSLTENTLDANSRFFSSKDEMPRFAFTMGIASIMHAKKIIMLVSGRDKHEALLRMLDEKIAPDCPATLLKAHPDVTILCDKEAYEG